MLANSSTESFHEHYMDITTSGRADALSGRFILVEDKEEELVRRAEEIQRADLHILTLRT